MNKLLPVDITIIFSEQHLQNVAFDIQKWLQAKQILSVKKILPSQFYNVVVFLVDQESELSAIWQLVAAGVTTIPILFVVNDKPWQHSYIKKAFFLDHPSIDQFLNVCDSNSAIFLSSHGRSDTISLSDGKICGANFHNLSPQFDEMIDSDQIMPSCIKTGYCYRPDMPILSLKRKTPRILFTNACESFSWGKDSVIGLKWSFHNAVISNKTESFIGTPFVRNSLAQEIEIASELFKTGLPLWQVVHIINYNSQRIGLDTCGLIIRGNPLVRIDNLRRIGCSELVFDKNGTMTIDIPINTQATRLVSSSKLYPDSIISRKEKFLYAFAPGIPKYEEEAWIIGNGSAEILLDNNKQAIKKGFERELTADRTWRELGTFIPLTTKELGLRNRWINTISNAQNLILPANIDSLVAAKMQQRIKDAKEARSKLEREFVDRLMEQVKKKAPQCPITLAHKRLIFSNKTGKTVCPACNRRATKIHFKYSWKAIRCPRCGIVSLYNGTKLIQVISLPKELSSGKQIEVNFKVNCETFSSAIYRGDHEGISMEKQSTYNWIMRIDKNTPPHFYYLRVYAVHEGSFEAVHRIVEVVR